MTERTPNLHSPKPDQSDQPPAKAVRADHQGSISIEDYLRKALALAEVKVSSKSAELPLRQARGRVLAADVFSKVATPTFTNSAMDGYAIRSEDVEDRPAQVEDAEGEPVEPRLLPLRFEIVGEQPAGLARDLQVGRGEAVRIMTGAPIPKGADTVVRSEDTDEDEGYVLVHQPPAKGANIRTKAEDAPAGELILEAGRVLTARDLSAAAAVGIATLEVREKVTVGIVSTGDELVEPGKPLKEGQIYESNATLLGGLVEELGCKAVYRHGVADTEEALAEELDELAESVDAILLSGGVSVGRFDVVRNLLSEQPAALFTRVKLQPGKPQGMGFWSRDRTPAELTDGVPFLAFPGNPVGSFVSFQVFGKPFLRALQGAKHTEPTYFWAKAGETWSGPSGRTQYLAATTRTEMVGDLPRVYPVSKLGSGSHLVTSLADATVLAIGPEEVTTVNEGDLVKVMEIA